MAAGNYSNFFSEMLGKFCFKAPVLIVGNCFRSRGKLFLRLTVLTPGRANKLIKDDFAYENQFRR